MDSPPIREKNSFLDDLSEVLEELSDSDEESHPDFNLHQIIADTADSVPLPLSHAEIDEVRRPRGARDRGWSAAWFLLVPFSLIFPFFVSSSFSSNSDISTPAAKFLAIVPYLNILVSFLLTSKILTLLYAATPHPSNLSSVEISSSPMSSSASASASPSPSPSPSIPETLDDSIDEVGTLITSVAAMRPLLLLTSALFIIIFLPSSSFPYIFIPSLPLLTFLATACRASNNGNNGNNGNNDNDNDYDNSDSAKKFFTALTSSALSILKQTYRKPRLHPLLLSFHILLLGPLLLLQISSFTHSLTTDSKILILVCAAGGVWGTRIVKELVGMIGAGGVYLYFSRASKVVDEVEMEMEMEIRKNEKMVKQATNDEVSERSERAFRVCSVFWTVPEQKYAPGQTRHCVHILSV